VFAFNSNFFGGPFRLIAAPHDPVPLRDLPDPVQRMAGKVVLTTLAFRKAKVVTEADSKG
jgi:hypothetical protein